MNEYAVIDIVLLVLVLLLLIRGFVRGFVGEFFSLGAPVLGILGAFFFYENGARFLRSKFFHNTNYIHEVLAFIAIFIIIFLVCKIIQKIIIDVVEGLNLNTTNKVLGIFLGLAEGILASSLVLFIIYIQPLFDPYNVLHGSIFGRILLPLIIETSREMIGYPV